MRKRRNSDHDFQRRVHRARGFWLYPFSKVKQQSGEGWFIDWLGEPEGIPIDEVEIGHKVADWSLNETVYWTVRDVDVDHGRIWLEPTDENPFITGVGAGGARLTDWDWKALTGEAHKEGVNRALRWVQAGCKARYDVFTKLLKGVVPTQFGPNGAQGGWYNVDDTSNVGSREGMTKREIVAWDAHALARLGLDVPASALRGEVDPDVWTRFVDGSDETSGKMRQTLLEGEDWGDPNVAIRFVLEHPVSSIKLRNWNALLDLWQPTPRPMIERATAPSRWEDPAWVARYKRISKDIEDRWRAGEFVRRDLEPVVRKLASTVFDLKNEQCQESMDFDPYYQLKERAINLAGREGWREVLRAHEDAFDPGNRKYVAWGWKELGDAQALLRMEAKERHPEPLASILSSLEDLGVDPLALAEESPERYTEVLALVGEESSAGYHAKELAQFLDNRRRHRHNPRSNRRR